MAMAKKRAIHFVALDVSGSMQAPLKLRSNAQDANRGSNDLDPKRVQTVFDVVSRLADESVSSAKEHDVYAAVLCFGLNDVSTCDLLALLEDRASYLELADLAMDPSATELPLEEATQRLRDYGIYSASSYLRRSGRSARGGDLYTVVGHEPLIKLLSRAGAPYCEKYVAKHITEQNAGRYFLGFSSARNQSLLTKLVSWLPEECKRPYTAASFGVGIASNVPLFGGAVSWLANNAEKSAVSDATQYADGLLGGSGTNNTASDDRNRVQSLLRRVPNATPRPLSEVIKLTKRLQSALNKTAPGNQSQRSSTHVDWERLLDDIEPYLYGGTPMCKALSSVYPTFSDSQYSSRTLVLISDGDATDGNPLTAAKTLRDAGGVIFACLLTDSAISQPRKLLGPTDADWSWPSAARAMFEMASTVSYESSAVQALRRRGWLMPTSDQIKLFVQANNPMIVDEFATASRNLGNNADSLSELVGQVSLDLYTKALNNGAEPTDQKDRGICWAHATASVIHLASLRIIGRNVPDFFQIRANLLSVFGDDDKGRVTGDVLTRICPAYRLHCKEVDEVGARAAIYSRRPVVATFAIDDSRWSLFSRFYRTTPGGTLTSNDMRSMPAGSLGGHAVVLIRCSDTSLTFMNSWGANWGNNGFFTIDKPSTLEVSGGPKMRFFDVYWYTSDLSDAEKEAWKQYEKEKGNEYLGNLPSGFHDLPVQCPNCFKYAKASEYGGSWNEARCGNCSRTFHPTVAALVRNLYESNFDAV